MSSSFAGSVALVALHNGLAPHADPLDCEDLRGPRSLFGESRRMPRPVSSWLPERLPGAFSAAPDYRHCLLLWECGESMAPAARAGRILTDACRSDHAEPGLRSGHAGPELRSSHAGPELRLGAGCPLEVPARTFIGGSCTSTFSVAWKLAGDGLLPEWGAVLCSRQTEGRGQLRRPWHSPRGNLYVTFRLPGDPLLQGDCCSLIVGWMLVRAFQALGFSLSLKWPNDLLLEERSKVGGLLIEERSGVLLAGLGVNLVEAPPRSGLREAGSLGAAVLLPHHARDHGGGAAPFMSRDGTAGAGSSRDAEEGGDWAEEPLAPFPLWRLLVSGLILAYSRSVAGRELSGLLADIDGVLAWKGRRVTLRDGGDEPLLGRCMGLGPSGGLLLGQDSGERREMFSGSLFPAS